MIGDPGYIALFLIFVFWVSLIFLALLVGVFPRRWRQKGKVKHYQSGIPH